MKGKVIFWNVRKGWGFFSGEDGQDYFAHHRDIATAASYKVLRDNEPVEFDVIKTPKGLKAVNIRMQNFKPLQEAAHGNAHSDNDIDL
jgi:CspA family cold shock protein